MDPKLNYRTVAGFDVIYHSECNFSDVADLVAKANAEAVGGHGDWVLPDTFTAQALRLVGGAGVFEAWTSSPYCGPGFASEPDSVWGVDFSDGKLRSLTSGQVRLVRASQCLALGKAAHTKSIEVGRMNMGALHKPRWLSLLIEIGRPLDLEYRNAKPLMSSEIEFTQEVNGFDIIGHNSCTFNGARDLVKKSNAEAVGGHSDWMLPDFLTAQALRLVNAEGNFEAWTSSPYAGNTLCAWTVRFGDGYGRGKSISDDSNQNNVRLVRASQCLALGEAGHRISLAEAGIELDAEEEQPLVDRPRGG